MGVDWYSCKNCGETFPDCGDYTGCECGEHWCCDDCAEADGFQYEEEGFTPEGSKWSQETSCNFCRKEDYDEFELLRFALDKLGLSREQLIELYKQK
jgi:hypothetical protein